MASPVLRWFKRDVTWSPFAPCCQLCHFACLKPVVRIANGDHVSVGCCNSLPVAKHLNCNPWLWELCNGRNFKDQTRLLIQHHWNKQSLTKDYLYIIWPGTPPHLGSFSLLLPVGVVTVHSVYGSRFNPSSTTSLICKRQNSNNHSKTKVSIKAFLTFIVSRICFLLNLK